MDEELESSGNDTRPPEERVPSAVTAKIVSIATAAKERNARQRAEQRVYQQLELPIEELLPAESGESKYPRGEDTKREFTHAKQFAVAECRSIFGLFREYFKRDNPAAQRTIERGPF